MIIVPFAGILVVPLGLLSGVLSLGLGALPFAGLNQWTADAFVSLTSFFSGLPGATASLPAPGILFAAAYVGMVLSLGSLLRRRILSRVRPLEHPAGTSRAVAVALTASLGVLALSLLLPLLMKSRDRLMFLDVGQGDCCLIETGDGKRILIDGGGAMDNRFDVGQRVVAPVLWNRNIGTIDLAVLSHPHPDHMNGLASLLRSFAVKEVRTSGRDLDAEGYADFRRTAEERGTVVRPLESGKEMTVGSLSLEALHPDSGFVDAGRKAYETENNRSLVLRLAMGGKRFLFPGDVHKEAEGHLAASERDLRSDLIKVPHHGSKTSSTDRFLASVRPSIAVVSVGAGNPYRQPSDDVVERYRASGIRLYRTDRDGALLINVDKGELSVVGWGSLLLRSVSPFEPGSWLRGEQENWKRLLIREWAT